MPLHRLRTQSTGVLAGVLVVSLAACAPSAPGRAPEWPAPATEESSGRIGAAKREAAVPTGPEDAAGVEPPPARGPMDAGPRPPVRPADDATPQVAAATRLTEEGRRRTEAGDHDTALDLLERAIALDPNSAFAYCSLAEAYLDLGRYEQAFAFAERAAALSTGSQAPWRSRSFALQGQILETAGRYDGARAAYRSALAVDAGNLAAQSGLARLGEARQ